ncbi:hypothetical protein MKS83_17190 [Chryseobacterium sp. Y16C]|uniref:hypothetical protein n=1 Tax=Chryseobacterium sp. Y16C TaxID=2920939 RepID=UPI001F0A6994|nr:hypothetical protein [Chryseobacterium sp. Y16C]UMQ41125.1 hypothetical protein MKS83_17190 [Chryseobacterium sp. Y16C]
MITYITLQDDTLEKIASGLKIENPIYLREFHNAHCAKHERFYTDLKPGQSLLLPFGNEIIELNKKIIENGDSLYYHPPHGKIPFQIPLLKGKYKINHQKFLGDEQLTDYQYQVELAYIKLENNYHVFSFQMSDFKKEGIESDTKMSSLAKACVEILYPLHISLNEELEIKDIHLTSPENLIKDHLETLKSYFTDQYSNSYINQMKRVAENKEVLLENLKNTLPVHFLTGAFYRATYGDWTDSQIDYDFIPWLTNASPIRFEIQNTIQSKENNTVLKITQSGRSSDNRNMDQLYSKSFIFDAKAPSTENAVDCSHIAEYSFNRTDLSLQKIEASFNIFIDDVTEKEIFSMEKQQN